MFTRAMKIIAKIVDKEKKGKTEFNFDSLDARKPDDINYMWNKLFDFQKSFMLLMTVFERFIVFRYGIGNAKDCSEQEAKFAKSDLFKGALDQVISEGISRTIYDWRNPNKKIELQKKYSIGSLEYYRQVRHNLIHRGKVGSADANILQESLIEFYDIMEIVLKESYKI
jgi:hypothetical protein